jgi:hypothetical protein
MRETNYDATDRPVLKNVLDGNRIGSLSRSLRRCFESLNTSFEKFLIQINKATIVFPPISAFDFM